jgi:UDP-N-acetylglucosamine acyltransferase
MIDKTAIIHPKANIETEISVGPYAVIEEGVQIAKGVVISAHAQIKGNTVIGANTFIGPGAIIGEAPQMLTSTENIGRVNIGENNIIREYVTINSSTGEDRATSVGDNNFFMAFSHVAHDCRIANNVVICNGALLAGHVQVGDSAFISGNVVVHQFVRIGKLTMIGGLSRVNQDVVPFMMVVGDSRVWGVNTVGLKRAGIDPSERKNIKQAYSLLYRSPISQKNALDKLEKIESKHVKEMTIFILSTQRGICGPKKSSFLEKLFLDYPYALRNKIPTYRYFSTAAKRHVS